MKEYKLKELFDLQMGKTPSRNNVDYWNDPVYKWISIGDLSKSGKYISETKEYLSEKAIIESGISIIPENTVIMSFKLSIGKTAITSEPMYSNEAIMSFRDKHITELMPDYIYYLLLSKDWDVGTNKAVMGKTLNKATLSEIVVGIHDIAEQKIIVSTLDKLGTIIEERKIELQKLDELIKARFVEMFGEGLADDGKYPLIPISEIGKVVSGATPKTSIDEYWDGDNLWITPAEISDDTFVVSDTVRKITDEGVKSCAVNLLPIGTVILSSRAPIGKVVIAGAPMYCNQGFKNIIPNGKIDSVYLYELLAMETEYLNSLGRGATFKEISKQIVENIRIKVPPIKIQRDFSNFVKQVDKSKVVEISEAA